jgi:arylsulfatase A-like enzyme
MVYFIDEAIGNVTTQLKATGMWDNTLVVVHAE